MSDDEVISFPVRTNIVHYGSLEDQVATFRVREDEQVRVARTEVRDYEDNESRQELLEEFEKKKKARMIHVSTDDSEVKAQLRQLAEPICLFGEGPADRRGRLKELLVNMGTDAIKKTKEEVQPQKIKTETENVTWYHPGTNNLRDARVWIAEYSMYRTATRIQNAKEEKKVPPPIVNAKLQELFKKNRSTSLLFSQIADTRPISFCQFSPNGELLATASWSGLCKLWTVPESKEVAVLRGHTLQANCVTFHPQATLTQDENACNLASSGQDGSVFLWSMKSDVPIRSLEGHAPCKVPRLAFHPSGRFLGTCCFDRSWRFWDVEANEELLHQEGHSREVYDIAFHLDGSLALTGSMDAYGRVWDLRTGRCIMFLEGHLKSILSVDFSPNGYQMATGSEDNSVKIWDLRQRKCLYTIPSHTGLVSKVKFQPSNGLYLLTSSYDKTAKIWNHPNWAPSQVLAGHEGRLMCVDVSHDDKFIATASFEKNFKLWAPEM